MALHDSLYDSNRLPPKYEDFECPVCDSKEYTQVTSNNGIYGPAGRIWLDHCVCLGCSVMFHDAEKFSKKKPSG